MNGLVNNSSPNYTTLQNIAGENRSISNTSIAEPVQNENGYHSDDLSFPAKIEREFITGSAIAPALFHATTRTVSDVEVGYGGEVSYPIHEALNWHVARFGHQVRENLEAILFENEDGSPWQAKLSRSLEPGEKPYLAPTGNGSRAFLPTIPDDIRQAIGQRYNCDVPPAGESFWDWVEQHPEIPIVSTEGGKKSLSVLSLSYVAIALYGVNSGYRTTDALGEKCPPILIPDIARFCQPGRRFVLAFDQDSKLETRERVGVALAQFGGALEMAGCHVDIVVWDSDQGKGADDLIVANGPAAWDFAYAQRWDLAHWQNFQRLNNPEFWQQTHLPTQNFAQRYLPTIPLPAPGLTAVSSATGTGKTENVEDFLNQFFERHPDGIADLIGYRNGLLIQTCERINEKTRVTITHKHAMDSGSGGFLGAPSLAYCLNSLDQRIDTLNRVIDQGRMVLIGLDEVDFVLAHWLEMMKSQPQTGLNFAHLLRRIGEGHGYIVALQAGLTGLPIDFLQAITGPIFPLSLIENAWRGDPWDVTMVSPLSQQGKPTNSLASLGAAQRVIESIRAGEFPLITTSGQGWLEALELCLQGENFRLLRIDSDTVAAARQAGKNRTREQSIILEFFDKPKTATRRARRAGYNAVGLSPTGETGISIDGAPFDRVIELATAHTSEQSLQRLARERNNGIPREIFAADRSANYRGESLSPDQIAKNWKINLQEGFTAAAVRETLTPDLVEKYDRQTGELLQIMLDFAAKYQARRHVDMCRLNANIEARLTRAGHYVERATMTIDENFRAQWRAAKRAIDQRKPELFAIRPTIPLAEAHEILRSGTGTREENYSAQKTILSERYPGLDLNDVDLASRLVFERRGAALAAYTQTWLLKNPDVARAIDQESWQTHLGRGIVWAPAIKREALKCQTIADTGFMAILALAEYSETTPKIVDFRQRCLENKYVLRQVFGYASAFDEAHTGIEMVGWFARRLGLKQQRVRRVGSRSDQVWIWKIVDSNPDDRAAVEAALNLKWGISEPAQSGDFANGRSDFSINNLTQKIGSTGSEPPPDLAVWLTDDAISDARKMLDAAESRELREIVEALFPTEIRKLALTA